MKPTKTNPALAALATKAETALQACEKSGKIWTRSRSGMMLKNMIIGSHGTPLRQLRQLSAELNRKKEALVEAKYGVLKRRKQADLKREEAERSSGALKELLLLEAEELEALAMTVERPYIGAMREVVQLAEIYRQLEAKAVKTYGKLDEEVFERDECNYWVHRAISQSLRDVRQFGVVSVGNQELLEQIGLDPAVIQAMLRQFLSENAESRNVSSQAVEDFVSSCVKRFAQASVERVRRQGLPVDIMTEHLYIEHDDTETTGENQ